jgi:hypothetical protein
VDAPEHWGTSSLERARPTPADDLVPHPVTRWTRAATSTAPPARVWRWLCQLTVAPYSYDLLDNAGRPSPRTLTPGADHLVVGQPLLVLFVIDSFADGEHLTLRLRRPGRGLVGEFAITYTVRPDGERRTRLVATVVLGGTPAVVGTLLRYALAWGDLIMMRRQLTRLAALAAA